MNILNFRIAIFLLLVMALHQQMSAAEGLRTNRVVIASTLLSDLGYEARTNRPSLHAAESRVRAAEANRASVRTWEDPVFNVGGAFTSNRGSDLSEEGDIVYGLEQKLPLWSKPRLARKVADAEVERARAQGDYDLQMTRLEVARQVFAAALAERAVEIGSEDLRWIETMASLAGERYRAGDGSQVDLLRLQNERAKRTEQLRTESFDRDQEYIELNRLIGRPLESTWPSLELPPVGPRIEFTEQLRRMTLRYEARLKTLRREVDAAEATARLTEKQRLPDVSVGVEGRQYTGDAGFREGMVTLSLNLPWLNRPKYQKEIERDRERARAASQELADYELFVPTEARRVVTRAEAARRQAVLYRDEIIPRSELALQSAHAAWLANRGMFLDVMEARRMLLEARLEYARAIAEQYSMLIELTLCCGAADLEALEMLNEPANGDADPTDSSKNKNSPPANSAE